MAARAADGSDAQASATRSDDGIRRWRGRGTRASDEPSSLLRSAYWYAVRCHARQRRKSDSAPFISHPVEVARLLRDAGCPEVVIVAGLLHDVVEKCDVTVSELATRFGADVAQLVQAVSDDASLPAFRDRKQMLREQVRRAGGDAALLFAADKISKVRELPRLFDRVQRNHERLDLSTTDSHGHDDLQHDHQMRIEHYTESLRMLQHVAPEHPLVKRLADELDARVIAISPPDARDPPPQTSFIANHAPAEPVPRQEHATC